MAQLPTTDKSLGQHWLQDLYSLEAMVEAADITSEDTVLEVGPGPGTLTKQLVTTAQKVVAVEFDKKLAAALPKRVPADNLTVIQQDILTFDLSAMPEDYKVVANIPYYLTSNLLRRLCEYPVHFSKAAVLIQKEVAERVCARPGDMSLLSVSVQFYCEVSLGLVVPAYLFTPPPKVDSQILQLTYRSQPLFPDVHPDRFFALVKAGFAQRRKTLLNSLSSGLSLTKTDTTALLHAANIAPATRAQALTLEQWHTLYQQHYAEKA